MNALAPGVNGPALTLALLLMATVAVACFFGLRWREAVSDSYDALTEAEDLRTTSYVARREAEDLRAGIGMMRARVERAEAREATARDLLDTVETRVLTERIPMRIFSLVVPGLTVERDCREVDRYARRLVDVDVPRLLTEEGLVLRSDHRIEMERLLDGGVEVRYLALVSPRVPYPETPDDARVLSAPRLVKSPL